MPITQVEAARPQTNASNSNPNKAKELEELARLIQAATGSINMAVETSQQLASLGGQPRFQQRQNQA